MKQFLRFLKPFTAGVLLAVVLLFAQAFCDLNLPNYMSDMVNVGIQQNGISESAPKSITKEGFEFMKLVMPQEDIEIFENSYSLSTNTEDYPNFEGEEFYLMNEDADTEAVELAFSYATWTLTSILQEMSDESSQTQTSMNISELYSISPMLSSIDDETMANYQEISKKMDVSFVTQTGNVFTSSFYEELGVNLDDTRLSYIINIGVLMLLIALAGGASTVAVSFITSKISAGVSRNLRNQLFKKINTFANEEHDKFSEASLITRSTNDVLQVQTLCMMGIRFLIYSPIMMIGGVIMAVNKSASMAWVILVACLSIICLLGIILTLAIPKFKRIQKLVDRINLVTRETLNGLMVIRAFGTAKHEKNRFNESNDEYAKNNLFVNRAMATLMPFMTFIMNGVTVLIVWIGGQQISESTMQIGDMMAYMQYAMQIIMSFFMLSMIFVFLPRALVSAQRIAEVLDTPVSIKDPVNPKKLPSENATLEFKDVSFKYSGADEYAIENISFTAKPSQTVAFIGSTGSGKTTIVNLIPRFYDATKGSVLISGINVKDVSQHDLHSIIGYVPQKSVLMSGTIDSNIKYGNKDLSNEDMLKVAKTAQASDFIEEKEDKFNSYIAQGGSNVSGGQKQRLSIARALAINPLIYLFDDSFSALDYKTDVTLRKALKDNTQNATVIIIAQRVGTILDADVIHVLDEGKIIASGTHKELLKNCPTYLEIASTQLSKEELENE